MNLSVCHCHQGARGHGGPGHGQGQPQAQAHWKSRAHSRCELFVFPPVSAACWCTVASASLSTVVTSAGARRHKKHKGTWQGVGESSLLHRLLYLQ